MSLFDWLVGSVGRLAGWLVDLVGRTVCTVGALQLSWIDSIWYRCAVARVTLANREQKRK